jgi:hypothetical protein
MWCNVACRPVGGADVCRHNGWQHRRCVHLCSSGEHQAGVHSQLSIRRANIIVSNLHISSHTSAAAPAAQGPVQPAVPFGSHSVVSAGTCYSLSCRRPSFQTYQTRADAAKGCGGHSVVRPNIPRVQSFHLTAEYRTTVDNSCSSCFCIRLCACTHPSLVRLAVCGRCGPLCTA